MKFVIKSAKICDINSPFNGKKSDVLIEKGKIKQIGGNIPSSVKSIEGKGMWLTPGWVDSWASFGDPGYEHKEEINSGRDAAFNGGFTDVLLIPDTLPIIQSKNEVKYILGKNGDHGTRVHPHAALTRDFDGVTLTEMIDLFENGAVAFTDGGPIQKGETIVKALRYLQKFNGLLIQLPEDESLSENGQMHEGHMSTNLGMRGIPSVAEEIVIQRDIELVKYTGGRIHFANVSTAKGLDLIRKGKKQGLSITCSMACYQTSFLDEDLESFDTVFKVSPPLRSKSDRTGLIKGLLDGTIDVINSNHKPQDEESKKLEFDLSTPGMISLQTFAANLAQLSEDVPMEELLSKVTNIPRQLFRLNSTPIEEGSNAELTLFDPGFKWEFNSTENLSKSNNSPYLGQQIKGKVRMVINGDNIWMDEKL